MSRNRMIEMLEAAGFDRRFLEDLAIWALEELVRQLKRRRRLRS